MKNSARGDSSTCSELKAVEEACREASRTVEPCQLYVSVVSTPSPVNPEGTLFKIFTLPQALSCATCQGNQSGMVRYSAPLPASP
jgi:hypothetical protein